MGNVPHYPWYVDDFLSSPWVMNATLKQEGIYRRLLDLQWKSPGCQIRNNIKHIRSFLKKANDRVSEDEIREVLNANFTPIVLNGDTEVWRNERLYIEFQRVLKKSSAASEAVKLRKNRPVRQSNDSPSIATYGQSSDSPPEVKVFPEPKAEEEKDSLLPKTVSLKIMSIATEKANLAWIEFEQQLVALEKGSRVAIQDQFSREIFLSMNLTKETIGQIDPLWIKTTFIGEYRKREIASFATRKRDNE